jgi:hypothetical protein
LSSRNAAKATCALNAGVCVRLVRRADFFVAIENSCRRPFRDRHHARSFHLSRCSDFLSHFYLARFPADFMFQLSAEEFEALRSQFATLNDGEQPAGRGRHRKYLFYAFTEHGAIMAASVLNSPRAIEVSMYVVRAFVRLRELAATHQDLAKRLDALEEKTEALAMQHDTFSRNTRVS